MSELWWQTHRLLELGTFGDDVERVQRGLNDWKTSLKLVPDGDFGPKTEKAVKDFQREMRLIDDGIVGPVTHSVLFSKSFRYELRRPPWIQTGTLNLCRAACLESVFQKSAWPDRPRMTISDLQQKYNQHVGPGGDITIQGLRIIGKDLQFGEILKGKHVRAENLVRALRSRLPLLLVDNSTGTVMHARVLYGVHILHGVIFLLFMDPLPSEGHQSVQIEDVQSLNRLGFFAPNEAGL